MDYFTSDLHFGHNREFIYQKRGFSSVDEMDKTIINNFNSILTDDDRLFILGDLFLNISTEQGIAFLRSIKGKKYIIWGNHDTENRQNDIKMSNPPVFEKILGYSNIYKYDSKNFLLSHYPTITDNFGDKKILWNISGHTHSNKKFRDDYPIYNVALDAHGMFPVSIEQIIKDIKSRKE